MATCFTGYHACAFAAVGGYTGMHAVLSVVDSSSPTLTPTGAGGAVLAFLLALCTLWLMYAAAWAGQRRWPQSFTGFDVPPWRMGRLLAQSRGERAPGSAEDEA